MKRTITSSFLILLASGCAGGPVTATPPGAAAHFQKTEPAVQSMPARSRKKTTVTRAAPVARIPRKPMAALKPGRLPTRINRKDGTVMVLIDPLELRGGAAGSRGVIGSPAAFDSLPLKPFYMDRLEITVEQYRRFHPEYDEKPYTGNRPCPACPAMAIDWSGAARYCKQADKRLPTEQEWEFAARGGRKDPWPWGDKVLPDKGNIFGRGDGYIFAAPVGSFPKGASVFGVQDMIGNVWEWVDTPYTRPRVPGPAKSAAEGSAPLRIVKGGGWTSPAPITKITFRNIVDPAMKNPTFGFRCVQAAD